MGDRRAYGTYGRQESCIEGLVGRCNVQKPPVIPRLRQEDNTKMDLEEPGWIHDVD
jgi:hypothetical protein